ncbi:radical SAM family heme chaperone HemW [Defluviitalea phaphyphila]|uniref:radical SAM family heme chaperone HemW n=1 Tax=Defluviitalea phaphyphila TaxID=1473580 RepID=UPI00072FD19B|nr:radical SAM family heme chaperone HemW [Defluviitalea phaphyphila]
MENKISLYIHIPFCKSKCYYCDFASYANKEESMEDYVLALVNEMRNYGELFKNNKIATVFIGGGTPTILPLKLLKKVLKNIFVNFNIENNAEITIEANPGTLNHDNLSLLKEFGVNRLSIGLQAYQNNLLKKIGRIHTVEEFIKNFLLARKLGFNNINIDLMFALPNQTLKDWIVTLKEITKLNPEHISCYSLTIEENTPFGLLEKEGKLKKADEEIDRKMYHYAQKYLSTKEYIQYEISNFSKLEFESKHNLTYWTYKPYIGIGLGAHSFLEGKRYHNTYNLSKYIKSNGEINKLKEDIEVLSPKMQYAEYIFLGLRLLKGIDVTEFYNQFKISFDELFKEKVHKLINLGLLEKNKENIRLTHKGIDLSNIVFSEFLPE